MILQTIFILNCLSVAAQDTTIPSRPNILFAIADDWGVHAGAYGTPWVKTPNFDRVAKQGILFRNAFTPNAKCAPSRACILTGRNSWQLKEAANHLCYFPKEFKGWGEALSENHWQVGHTAKGWGPGVALDEKNKPRQMTGKPFNDHKSPPLSNGISNNDYAANFKDFLSTTSKEKPWAFWYGGLEPHRGYEFGSGVTKGGKKLSDIPKVPGYWPDNDTVRNDMLDYSFEVEHFDKHLGRMLDELEKQGLLHNTLIVVTSDHGMPFPRCKGSAYIDSNHVPLAIMWKKGITNPGRVVDDYVSFIDLAPTFLGVANLDWKKAGMAPTPGLSLQDLFASAKSGSINPVRDHVLIGMERHDIGRPGDVGYPIRGIIKSNLIYLHNFEPSRWPACNPETGYLNVDASPTKSLILEDHRSNPTDKFWNWCFAKRPGAELYNLEKDPDCLNNLALNPANAELCDSLKNQMFAKLKAEGDPRMEGKGNLFDEYLHSNKAHVNFYDRYMKGEKLKAGWVNPSDFEKKPLD